MGSRVRARFDRLPRWAAGLMVVLGVMLLVPAWALAVPEAAPSDPRPDQASAAADGVTGATVPVSTTVAPTTTTVSGVLAADLDATPAAVDSDSDEQPAPVLRKLPRTGPAQTFAHLLFGLGLLLCGLGFAQLGTHGRRFAAFPSHLRAEPIIGRYRPRHLSLRRSAR